MRIGFTGTGGTGKTTTLNLIKDKVGAPVLGSVTRRVYERLGVTEADQENMTDEGKLSLQMEILKERKLEELEFSGGFISDRTMIDHFAYALSRNQSVVTNEMLDELTDMLALNVSNYDIIFYFPISYFTPEDDGLRQQQESYRTVVDSIIFKMCHTLPIKEFITVKPGTPEERAKFVLDCIHLKFQLSSDLEELSQ